MLVSVLVEKVSRPVSAQGDTPDMSSYTVSIQVISISTGTVKLSWPSIASDLYGTYVIEGRAPQQSTLWREYATGLFASSYTIRGLDLENSGYEFRVRLSNKHGPGEPTRTATVGTSEYRSTGSVARRSRRSASMSRSASSSYFTQSLSRTPSSQSLNQVFNQSMDHSVDYSVDQPVTSRPINSHTPSHYTSTTSLSTLEHNDYSYVSPAHSSNYNTARVPRAQSVSRLGQTNNAIHHITHTVERLPRSQSTPRMMKTQSMQSLSYTESSTQPNPVSNYRTSSSSLSTFARSSSVSSYTPTTQSSYNPSSRSTSVSKSYTKPKPLTRSTSQPRLHNYSYISDNSLDDLDTTTADDNDARCVGLDAYRSSSSSSSYPYSHPVFFSGLSSIYNYFS